MATLVVRLATPGAGNYTFQDDLISLDKIETIAGGVGGTSHHNPITGKSGAGGGYSARTNAAILATVTAGSTWPYNVGLGYVSPNGINQGSGGPSWFGNASISDPACLCLANGGNGTNPGGIVTAVGDIKTAGGAGHITSGANPAWGGGGAGGPNGNGANGSTTGGGNGDAGSGGLGGAVDGNGADGTELAGGLAGSGGGGGPGGFIGAGHGGAYGAGGGQGQNGSATGGNPGDGIIILTMTVADPPPPLPPGPRKRASVRGTIIGMT